jgi:hypothetical protein
MSDRGSRWKSAKLCEDMSVHITLAVVSRGGKSLMRTARIPYQEDSTHFPSAHGRHIGLDGELCNKARKGPFFLIEICRRGATTDYHFDDATESHPSLNSGHQGSGYAMQFERARLQVMGWNSGEEQ